MIRLLRRPQPVLFSAGLLRRDLRYSAVEGSCYSLMVGLAETWLGAFFIAAGVGNFSIGLLASIPILLGSLLQLASPWGIRKTGSYRTWSVMCAGFHGCSLFLLAGLCSFGQTGFWFVFPVMILYWASSMSVGPAWNTWIEFVIPRPIRTRYLSRRMRVCQVSLLIAVCVAGLTLRGAESALSIFAGLFFVGGSLRIASAFLLGQHTEQPAWMSQHVARALQSGADDRLGETVRRTVPFFVAMQFSVFISGPFFAPFMLRNLGMGYGDFMFLIVLGYIGRVLTLHWASDVARRWGAGRLLWLGAAGMVPLAGFWWFHQSFWFLLAIQLLGGVAWGFYELAMSLVFIERIPGHLRPRVLSVFGVMNGFAMVGGSLLGGAVVSWFGNSTMGFMAVFSLSTVARFGAFYFFPGQLFEAGRTQGDVVAEVLFPAAPQINGRAEVHPFDTYVDRAPEPVFVGDRPVCIENDRDAGINIETLPGTVIPLPKGTSVSHDLREVG